MFSYHAIATLKNEDPNFPLFLAHDISESLRVILAALAFLLHPNIATQKSFVGSQRTAAEITANVYVSAEFPEDDSLRITGSVNTKAKDASVFHSIFVQDNAQEQ